MNKESWIDLWKDKWQELSPELRRDVKAAYLAEQDKPAYLGYSPVQYRDRKFFNEYSPWNLKIDKFENHPESELKISKLVQGAQSVGINYKKWTVPVHYVNFKKMDIVNLRSEDGQPFHSLVDPNQEGIAKAPYCPEIWADPEADGHICLIDMEEGIALDASRLNLAKGTASTFNSWNINHFGVGNPFMGASPWKYGSRAGGTPLIAGLIRSTDPLDHALVCTIPNVEIGNVLIPPACRAYETYDEGEPHNIPYGSRLYLDHSVDTSSMPDGIREVLECLKTYGCIVADRARAFALYAQNLGVDGLAWERGFPEINQLANYLDLTKLHVLDYRGLEIRK